MSLSKIVILIAAVWVGVFIYRTQTLIKPFVNAETEDASSPSLLSMFTGSMNRAEHSSSSNRTETYQQTGGIGGVGSGSGVRGYLGGNSGGGIGGIGANTNSARLEGSFSSPRRPPSAKPLLAACAKGDLKKAQAQLEKGVPVNGMDEEGRTALMAASQYGQDETASLLLAAGADIKLKDKHGFNALDHASGRGLVQTVDFLLKVTKLEDSRHTLEYATIIAAVNSNNTALLPQGTGELKSVNRVNIDGQSPLMLAAGGGGLPMMQALFARGANATVTNPDKQSALHWAAWNNQAAALELLVAQGAELNLADTGGNTALMLAAQSGSQQAAKLLLDKGADRYLANKQGQTAYFMAKAKENQPLMAMLKF